MIQSIGYVLERHDRSLFSGDERFSYLKTVKPMEYAVVKSPSSGVTLFLQSVAAATTFSSPIKSICAKP